MSEAVLCGLISAFASIVVSIISVNSALRKQNEENIRREIKRDTETDMRLNAIEHKLDVHNGYAEKLGGIATDLAVLKQKLEDNIKGD